MNLLFKYKLCLNTLEQVSCWYSAVLQSDTSGARPTWKCSGGRVRW